MYAPIGALLPRKLLPKLLPRRCPALDLVPQRTFGAGVPQLLSGHACHFAVRSANPAF